MAKLWKKFKVLDVFQKTVEDATERSTYGALITGIAVAVILLLCYGETRFYLSPPKGAATTTLTVNHVFKQESIPIYIRMLFMELPCEAVYIDAMDRFGAVVETNQNLVKEHWKGDFGTLINTDGKMTYRWFDRAYAKEERFWQRLRQFIHTPPPGQCLPCYINNQVDNMVCCNTCLRLKQVFVENGRDASEADNYAQCTSKERDGCLVDGYINVNQHRGNLHILAGSSHALYGGGHTHQWNPAHRKLGFNATHYIGLFSFGERYPDMVNPLDGFIYTEMGLSRQQYFLEVVPTKHVGPMGSVTYTNQYAATFTNNPVDLTAPHAQLPGVFIHYDFSPLKIHIVSRSESFLQFITNLCALVGGVWVVTGLTYKMTAGFVELLFGGVFKKHRVLTS